jgi:hypothetical protein
MSMQHQEAITRSINPELSLSSRSLTEALLRRFVGDLECGELAIEMPAGNRLVLGGRRPGSQAKVAPGVRLGYRIRGGLLRRRIVFARPCRTPETTVIEAVQHSQSLVEIGLGLRVSGGDLHMRIAKPAHQRRWRL